MLDISIIVPIYNAERTLKKCLDSLLNQTKKELELIVINDGSTDNSEQIIKSYNDPRINYIKQENKGIGKTRNLGIKKATGKYIMFVDSDDYLDKNACKQLFDKAFSNSLDIVICDFYIQKKDTITEEKLIDFKPSSLKDMPNLIYDINLAPWNKIYKTEFLKKNKIRFVENLKYEDAPFVCESLDKANKIGKVNKCLNYYVINEKSETTVRDKRVFDIIKIVDIIRNYFKDKKYMDEVVDKLTIRILMNYNIQQRYQEDKKLAMKFIEESFIYLKKNIPNYRNNVYYKERKILKSTIEKNKNITKIYCHIYRNKKKKKEDQ